MNDTPILFKPCHVGHARLYENPPTACCYRLSRPLPWWLRVGLVFSLGRVKHHSRENLRMMARGGFSNNIATQVMMRFVPDHWQWLSHQRLKWAMRRALLLTARQLAIFYWWGKRP